MQEFIQKLGLATAYDNPPPRQNKSLNSVSIALLRTINHYDIKAKDKALLMPHLKQIDEVFENYENESLIDEGSRKRVLNMSSPINFLSLFHS